MSLIHKAKSSVLESINRVSLAKKVISLQHKLTEVLLTQPLNDVLIKETESL